MRPRSSSFSLVVGFEWPSSMRSRTALRAWAIRSSNFTGLVSNNAAWQSCRQSGRKCVCSILLIFSFYRTHAALASTPLFVSDYMTFWRMGLILKTLAEQARKRFSKSIVLRDAQSSQWLTVGLNVEIGVNRVSFGNFCSHFVLHGMGAEQTARLCSYRSHFQ